MCNGSLWTPCEQGQSGHGKLKREALRKQAIEVQGQSLLSTPSALVLLVTRVSEPGRGSYSYPQWKVIVLAPKNTVATPPSSWELQPLTLHPKAKIGKGLFIALSGTF